MTESHHNIEDKEIRGVTLKLVRGLLVGYTSLILFGFGAWYSIKTQLHDNSKDQAASNKLQDVQIQSINTQLNQIRIDQKLLNTAVTRQDIEIERIKTKFGL